MPQQDLEADVFLSESSEKQAAYVKKAILERKSSNGQKEPMQDFSGNHWAKCFVKHALARKAIASEFGVEVLPLPQSR